MDYFYAIIKKNRYHYIAFFISVIIMLVIYILAGIWPFGNRTILTMDLWGQYFPMIRNIQDAFLKDGLIWSWKGALGFNYLAQSAYYINSPTLLIFLLIPQKAVIYVFNYLILIKFGLSSLAFSVLLKFKFNKSDLISAVFSVAYSLCAYTIAYMSQTMWFDAVVLLPLVILGFELLMKFNKPFLFCLILFLIIVSNFFIAYSVCIFLILYFIVYQISIYKNIKAFINQLCSFSFYSLISCCASSFIIIPTYKAIKLTVASGLAFSGNIKFYNTTSEFIDRLIPGTSASLVNGVPNIYCSLFVLFMALIFILNPHINLKKRVSHILLAAFMLISFNTNILDYFWHGFHYPNQLPGRQSFLFCFIVILIAYESIINLKTVSNTRIFICSLFIITVLILSLFSKYNISILKIIIALLFVLIYLMLVIKLKHKYKIITGMLSVVIILEIGINSVYMAGKMPMSSTLSDYIYNDKTIAAFNSKYANKSNEFYRVETMPNFTFNPGQLYGYNGISYYSSLMTKGAYDFFKALGSSVYAKNVSTIYRQTPVTNMFFAVKYLLDINNHNNCFGLKKVDNIKNAIVYKNEYYLPLAFVCENDILNFKINCSKNHFIVQNKFLKSATGYNSDFYKLIKPVIKINEDNNHYIDLNDKTIFTYYYNVNNDTSLFYDCNFKKGTIIVYKNDKRIYSNDFQYNDLGCIGNFKRNDKVKIFIYSNEKLKSNGIELYTFNSKYFISAYKKLNKSVMSKINYEYSQINGVINVRKDGTLFTSIPNDGGWSLRIDGKKAKVMTVGDYLCAFKINKGVHSLEFSYMTPGLIPGVYVSASAIFIFSIIMVQYKIKRSNNLKSMKIKKNLEAI